MDKNYSDIDIYIRRANQQRSDALGEILSHGWKHLTQWVSRLLHHPGHLANS